MLSADGPASHWASSSSGAHSTETATMAWGWSRRTEGRNVDAVLLERLVHLVGGEVVGEGEGEPEHAGQLGAEGGRAEQPHLGEVAPPGHRCRVGDGPVGVDQVVDQLDHVLGEGVRTGSPVRRRARAVTWSVPGARPEPQVDAARVEGLEGGELLGDDQRGVVGQHDPAGPHPEGGGGVGQVTDEHGRGRTGHRGHPVVLGHPHPPVAQLLDDAGPAGWCRPGHRPASIRPPPWPGRGPKEAPWLYNTPPGSVLPWLRRAPPSRRPVRKERRSAPRCGPASFPCWPGWRRPPCRDGGRPLVVPGDIPALTHQGSVFDRLELVAPDAAADAPGPSNPARLDCQAMRRFSSNSMTVLTME